MTNPSSQDLVVTDNGYTELVAQEQMLSLLLWKQQYKAQVQRSHAAIKFLQQ